MERIGIDQESHLHLVGGPLHESPITHCDMCRSPLAEGDYHALDDLLLCRRCAVLSAVEVLIETSIANGKQLNSVEEQALGVLKQFVSELGR